MAHNLIIDFWFNELSPEQYWKKDPDLDRQIAERFGDYHHAAALGELWSWRSSVEGRLAEIIVLDQFSRNIYRDDPRSFAYDGMALLLAQQLVDLALDSQLPTEKRAFVYLPYMHSESLLIHDQALILFDQQGLENNLEFEHRHLAILKRFGRYPHRNEILGRVSTKEELAFLETPGSGF